MGPPAPPTREARLNIRVKLDYRQMHLWGIPPEQTLSPPGQQAGLHCASVVQAFPHT
jgi:hypothetical protein